jgi:hypothetical protein
LWPLKHLAMRRGMGLSGDLPRLARGEMPAAPPDTRTPGGTVVARRARGTRAK